MNPPVEAQSLSSLTSLLANPPQYPRNPTHKTLEPLVLYIVRVPGSKDVFLTPLKPPTKASISLEAIQSSLYYLHVPSAEDEEVRKSIDEELLLQSSEVVGSPVHRKPLPPVPYANYPPSERPIPPPKGYPFYQPGFDHHPNASQLERLHARSSHLRFRSDPEIRAKSASNLSSRPRSFQRQDVSEWLPTDIYQQAGRDSNSLNMYQSEYSDSVPVELSESRTIPSEQISSSYGTLTPQDPKLRQDTRQGSSITLIRRDPVSGNQWNVGTITDLYSDKSHQPVHPITIELTMPGYNRFANSHEIPYPTTDSYTADSVRQTFAESVSLKATHLDANPRQRTFMRTVEYRQQVSNTRQLKFHRRTDSEDSFSKPASPVKQIRNTLSFTSPWQGTCTFINGIDGKSLKCQHTLPMSSPTDEDNSTNVAELRFNLPWSVLAPITDRTAEPNALPISKLIGPRSGKDTIRRSVQHMRGLSIDKFNNQENIKPRTFNTQSQFENSDVADLAQRQLDEDRLSLKLGREKAGGGFKGTSAKLGKLIIPDEGLKMCDLVVAACMGVWWQHYESKTGNGIEYN